MLKKPFAYICALMRDQQRLENIQNNIIPYLEPNFYKIWPAFDCLNPEMNEILKKFEFDLSENSVIRKDPHGFERPMIALIISFILILEDAVEKDHNSMLFFEDDVELKPDLYQKLEKILPYLPEDAHFLRLFSKFRANEKRSVDEILAAQGEIIVPYPTPLTDPFGSDSIFILKQGFKPILEVMKKANNSLDNILITASSERRLKGYVLLTNDLCGHSRNSYLDPATNIGRISPTIPDECKIPILPFNPFLLS